MKALLIIGSIAALGLMTKGKKNTGSTIDFSNNAETIKAITSALKNNGIYNKYTQAAILSVIAKESQFRPIREGCYNNTSNSRIREIFSSRVSSLSDTQLSELKNNCVAFFDHVYSTIGGYKYRGGGYNQITGKSNYERRGANIGVNLKDHPELIEQPEVAAAALVDYMKETINNATAERRAHYHFSDINSFTNLSDAMGAIYHANAGFGKSYSDILRDPTGGRKKAFDKVQSLYNYINIL